jgi:hypothetical protein
LRALLNPAQDARVYPGTGKPNRPALEPDEALAVQRLPICDFCLDWSEYHGKTNSGRTANMCARHFKQHGRGLGNGNGRRLVVIRDRS